MGMGQTKEGVLSVLGKIRRMVVHWIGGDDDSPNLQRRKFMAGIGVVGAIASGCAAREVLIEDDFWRIVMADGPHCGECLYRLEIVVRGTRENPYPGDPIPPKFRVRHPATPTCRHSGREEIIEFPHYEVR